MLVAAWVTVGAVSGRVHSACANSLAPARSSFTLGPSSAVQTRTVQTREPETQTGLETGSRGLAELLYVVGARLALSGWEPEIIPYSCVIRTHAAPEETVWYRVSGENLLATRPGPVRILVVASVDGVFPRPAPSSGGSPVYPEDMLLYVAGALAENGQEGVAFALVSGSFQGGAGLESLLRKACVGECNVLMLEGASWPGITVEFIRTLLPGPSTFAGKVLLVRYPDHSPAAARRYASKLAAQLKRGFLTSCSSKGSADGWVLLGGNLYPVRTVCLKWAGLSSVALSLIALLASKTGRSCLAEPGGFLTLVSFLFWPLLPLAALGAYVRLSGACLTRAGTVRVAVVVPVLVLFSWYLAGRHFANAYGELRRTNRKARFVSTLSDPRPFVCLFLGGLVIGAVLSLPSGEYYVSSLPHYILALLGFLLSFFFSALLRRQSGLLEAAVICITSAPAVVFPNASWEWLGLHSLVDSVVRPGRAAFVPFLVASAIAAELNRTFRSSTGRHARRPPGHIGVLVTAVVVTGLTALALVPPRATPEEKILLERVFSFRCLYETCGTGPLSNIEVDPETALVRWDPHGEDTRRHLGGDEAAPGNRSLRAAASFHPFYGELRDFTHRWADLGLSYVVKGVFDEAVVIDVTLTANFLKMPTFFKVTFEDISRSSARAGTTRRLQIDGSDFLGTPEELLREAGKKTYFIRWRPYEPTVKSVFKVYMPPEAAVRVSAQAVYLGETYSVSPRGASDDPARAWTTAVSSWEETLEIP
ncbi:MAG: hypothetical protein IMW97_04500 [Firmicutes bacterium]|nr:hypothetical protein [Candidatus Fermentithermobacillaceae bacterium]